MALHWNAQERPPKTQHRYVIYPGNTYFNSRITLKPSANRRACLTFCNTKKDQQRMLAESMVIKPCWSLLLRGSCCLWGWQWWFDVCCQDYLQYDSKTEVDTGNWSLFAWRREERDLYRWWHSGPIGSWPYGILSCLDRGQLLSWFPLSPYSFFSISSHSSFIVYGFHLFKWIWCTRVTCV